MNTSHKLLLSISILGIPKLLCLKKKSFQGSFISYFSDLNFLLNVLPYVEGYWHRGKECWDHLDSLHRSAGLQSTGEGCRCQNWGHGSAFNDEAILKKLSTKYISVIINSTSVFPFKSCFMIFIEFCLFCFHCKACNLYILLSERNWKVKKHLTIYLFT